MNRILIVEDDPDIAELVRLHLEKAGLSAWIADDGKMEDDVQNPGLILAARGIGYKCGEDHAEPRDRMDVL